MDENLKEFKEEFKNLVNEQKFNIDSLENLIINNINSYKEKLKLLTDELLSTEVNEKDLIVKKNMNGKKKDIN